MCDRFVIFFPLSHTHSQSLILLFSLSLWLLLWLRPLMVWPTKPVFAGPAAMATRKYSTVVSGVVCARIYVYVCVCIRGRKRDSER